MLEIESLTKSINRVALAILALLEGEVPHSREWPDGFEDTFKIETSAFYNCREAGICLTVKDYSVRRFGGENLVIFFGENRNSDSIFVAKWTQPIGINPPTLDDYKDEAHDNRRYFDYGQIIPAVDYIQKSIVDYCDEIAK